MTIPKTVRQSVQNLVDYNWHDEERDFADLSREDFEPVHHVFYDLRIVQDWLNIEKEDGE